MVDHRGHADIPVGPGAARRDRAAAALRRLRPTVEAGAASLPARDADALLARIDRRFLDLYEPIERIYGNDHDLDALLSRLLDRVVQAAAQRSEELRRLDRRREIAPDWYLAEGQLSYVCYTDRFAGSLAGVAERLDYLQELGITYLHLMPLLQPRPEPNDGGYAVMDFRAVDSRLGDMDDLELLTSALRARGVSLCLDLVVNHTAREHEWAQRALAGESRYRDYYRIFPDRTLPDEYEKTLWEVFPDTAPGNFTWEPALNGWVWTSFHDYQWDLNYENPQVFVEMVDVMLFLANRGVEILRLDAVPFLWKRPGTDSQNQPEAHWLLQAFRALVGIAAPAVVFKAEAVVPPDQLVQYLGAHDRHRPECELAYHNQLMVMTWSSAASRDTRLMTHSLQQMRIPPRGTTWITYVRIHDDIGWAVTEENAGAVGLNGFAHRRFLNDFYSGDFPGSFARGARFQQNPATGDTRISGMTASLCGIEQALELRNAHLLDQAIRRLLMVYGLAFTYGGIPLLYMGDEIALRSDRNYADNPHLAGDNRWLHRPCMDWRAAGRRHDLTTLEGRVFEGVTHLAAVRRSLPSLRSGGETRPVWTDNPHVFAYLRLSPERGHFLGLVNFNDVDETVDAGLLGLLRDPLDALEPSGHLPVHDGRIAVPGLGMRWLTED
jgi:amylosucrase